MVKVKLAVGPAVVVELYTGNDQLDVLVDVVLGSGVDVVISVVVDVVVDVWPGQLVTVGLHSVMVTVLVSVWVDVMVVSTSSCPWAATRERPVARTAKMLLSCILSAFMTAILKRFVQDRSTMDGSGIKAKVDKRRKNVWQQPNVVISSMNFRNDHPNERGGGVCSRSTGFKRSVRADAGKVEERSG